MLATLIFVLALSNIALCAPADFTKSPIRLDLHSWNRAIFGPYNPDEIDSAPLQHVLLEEDDAGFAVDPFAADVNTESALHQISVHYGEEDVIYQLDMTAYGFNGTEKFALLQNGISKCKLLKRRQLAPASASDDVRIPPMRTLQEMVTESSEMSERLSESDFLGGTVDIMFITANQIKLDNKDFDYAVEGAHPNRDHDFSIKGRFVLGCDCSHSHVEDTFVGVGNTRFSIRKLHVSCPKPLQFKQGPVQSAADVQIVEEAQTGGVVELNASTVLVGGEL